MKCDKVAMYSFVLLGICSILGGSHGTLLLPRLYHCIVIQYFVTRTLLYLIQKLLLSGVTEVLGAPRNSPC